MKKSYKLFLLSTLIIGMFMFKIDYVKAYDCTYYAQDGTKLEHNFVKDGNIDFYENGSKNYTPSEKFTASSCWEYVFYNRNGGMTCRLSLNGCGFKAGSNRTELTNHISEIGEEGFNGWSIATLGIGCFFGMDCGWGDGESRYELFYYDDQENLNNLNLQIDSYNKKFIDSIVNLAKKLSDSFNVDISNVSQSETFATNFFSNNTCGSLSFKKQLKDISDQEIIDYQKTISETTNEITKIITLADQLSEYGKVTVVKLLDVNTVFINNTLASLASSSDDTIKSSYYEGLANSLIGIKNNYNKFFPYATNGEDNKYTEYLNCISSKNDLLKEEIDKRVAQDAENQKLIEAQKKADEIKETIAGLVDQLVRGIDSNFFKDNGTVDCAGILGQDIIDWLKMAFTFIQIATVLIVIFTTILDFTKAVTSGDADIMKKVWKNFSRRLIVLVFLFLAPVLIEFILKIFQISGTDPNNPLCF